MAQARTAAHGAAAPARVDIVAPAELAATAIAALRARGISAHPAGGEQTSEAPSGVLACALADAPTAAATVELAAKCVAAAEAGRPVCVFVPDVRGTGRAAVERVAALAHLHAHGAALARDVDAWLEAIVFLVRFGLPSGPSAAVVAPAGSWLQVQATAIIAEAEAANVRSPLSSADDPTDVVLYDPALGTPSRTTPALYVPVATRPELVGDHGAPALFGTRAALGAIAILGHAAERIAVGLGPAPLTASAELEIDRELLERQLAHVARFASSQCIGDHETKGLLKAYGVPITRQGVATTPSMAVKFARRAGYPVEIKPYGFDLPSEPQGCPVERDVSSDALVRQAFTSVLTKSNRTGDEAAVIVRKAPPAGRDVSVTFLELPSLGWTVVLDAPGATRLAAAPAPLRLIDADALAAHVIASRAGDSDPDRVGLANILRRASHLVVDLADRIVSFQLPRVVVPGRGASAVVVDASATLR